MDSFKLLQNLFIERMGKALEIYCGEPTEKNFQILEKLCLQYNVVFK